MKCTSINSSLFCITIAMVVPVAEAFINEEAETTGEPVGRQISESSDTSGNTENTDIIVSPEAEGLSPPLYQAKDTMNVDVISNRIHISQPTVSIGKKYGLQHTVSNYSSNFSNYPMIPDGEPVIYGFTDNHKGFLHVATVNKKNDILNTNSWVQHIKVSDGKQTGTFYITTTEPVEYLFVNDAASTLVYESAPLEGYSGYYEWTKRDGTRVRFPSHREITSHLYSNNFDVRATMSEVIYPNGYKVKTEFSGDWNHVNYAGGILRVSSNTGYALEYQYTGSTEAVIAYEGMIPPGLDSAWSATVPTSVMAINTAVEACIRANRFAACSMENNWPQASFNYPEHMPRAFYLNNENDKVFRVTDAKGVITEYHHGVIMEGEKNHVTGNDLYRHPRINEIKVDGNTQFTYEHSYVESNAGCPSGFSRCPINSRTALTGSGRGIETATYAPPRPLSFGQTSLFTTTGGTSAYQVQATIFTGSGLFATIREAIRTTGDTPAFTTDGGHRITTFRSGVLAPDFNTSSTSVPLCQKSLQGGETFMYFYDSRQNLSKIIQVPSDTACPISAPAQEPVGLATWEAIYPDVCSNQKTCNQPDRVIDGSGNETHYTYHPESGQVATITYPANEQGVIPQTRYEYSEYFATYKNSIGNTITSTDGIYLLHSESYCINSNYTEEGCASGDEVVTTYEYETGNLNLVGKAVTADEKTLRTCFAHDIYGNQIGVTQPKGNTNKTTCL